MKWTEYQRKACGGFEPTFINGAEKNDKRYKRFKKEKKKYGFASYEIWNLDNEIICFILPRLKFFRDHHCGFPDGMTKEEYHAILDKIIEGMQLYLKHSFDVKVEDEDKKKINEAMKLFIEWLPNLWD